VNELTHTCQTVCEYLPQWGSFTMSLCFNMSVLHCAVQGYQSCRQKYNSLVVNEGVRVDVVLF